MSRTELQLSLNSGELTGGGVGNSNLKPLVRISHDAGFTENPMERENVESSVSRIFL